MYRIFQGAGVGWALCPRPHPSKSAHVIVREAPFYVVAPKELRERRPERFPNEKNFFVTRNAAKNFCGQLEEARRRLESAVVALSEAQQFEAAECFSLLASRGRSLREAVSFYVAHLDVSQRSALVPVVVEEFLVEKRNARLSDAHMAPLTSRVRAFAVFHQDALISSLTSAGISSWLTQEYSNPVTRNNVHRAIRNLLRFAVGREYRADDPFDHIQKTKEPPKEIESLTVAEASALVNACDDVLLPFVAIGAFAGVRPEEIKGLQWENIDFQHNEIDVPAAVSKTGRRRLVKLLPNLGAWLARYEGRTGLVLPVDVRSRFETTRAKLAKAGTLTRWPNDVLRHSYASHHLAHFKDAPALALQMGHTDTSLIFSTYSKVVNEREGSAYWKILPPSHTPDP